MHGVILEKQRKTWTIRLNRPEALNALSLQMIRIIVRILKEAAVESAVEGVHFIGEGDRAFCAGGDVKAVWEEGMADKTKPHRYFREEYTMNRMLFHFSKRLSVFMNGITMGGGFGIAGPCHKRTVCKNTVFAMPETGIGLFPDVGSAYFLSRCPGEIGAYLAVTGRTISAADMVHAGLATDSVDDLPPSELKELRPEIDRAFKHDTIEGILAALERGNTWAKDMAALIRTRSPTSLKISLRHVREARRQTFDQVIERDYALAQHVMLGHDFYEGVRALLIDKDRTPRWNPARLEDVDARVLNGYFSPALFTL